jgi:glycosyltransferase involved in cell wall biosynthesis
LKDSIPVNIVDIPGVQIDCKPVPQFSWGGLFFRTLNYGIYCWVVGNALKSAARDSGVPSGIHVHAGDKVARVIPGLYRLFRKLGKGAVPLWYTEHWAIFNEVVSDGFGKRGKVFQRDFLRLWEKVTVAAPVSLASQRSMHAYLGGAKPFVLFRNVVDTAVFKPRGMEHIEDDSKLPFAFLHVSSLEPRKNVLGMLRAFASLKQKHPNWSMQFRIVGGSNDLYLSQARTAALGLGLLHIFQPSVAFFGPRDTADVAFQMQCANVLVLFSDMENAPCVISEAHCCGLPVIASAVSGIPEMIQANNGLLVESGDETALTAAMEKAYLEREIWNSQEIAAEAASKYNPNAVTTAIDKSYSSLINPCVE